MAVINPPVIKSIADIKELIKKHYLMPDSDSEARRLMVEGFEFIKQRISYNTLLKTESGYGLDVDNMKGWIHIMVKDKLGGIIKGDKIIWEIDNKKIVMNPITCEISEYEIK